ncbi:MAG: hypothetical protein QOC81_2920 [Thermoanaerobaculia bacterium]|jgi:hypothetical protein|nr:hypothetical protein [Thermoanaerobaculia bacterium]
MWSDNESQIDLLQYAYLASAAVRIVTNADLSPTTIGVFGDWGGGKSTLLKLVQKELEKQDGVLAVSFNGWLFEGYDDAKTALMGTILDEIEDQIAAKRTLSEKAKELLKKLVARINWMRVAAVTGKYVVPLLLGQPHVAAAAAGSAIVAPREKETPSVDDLEKLAKAAPEGEANLRRNIRDFRRDFADLLIAAEIKTLVVFIDDLDRCLPDTIIETLEAIKLFLFVPGTAFVIAADPRIVKYAVRLRFPELPGTETEVGRDYLEKLIQIPLAIPPLGGAEIESYMNLLFAQKRLPGASFHTVCEHIAGFKPTTVSDRAFDATVCRTVLVGQPLQTELEEDFNLVLQIAPVLTKGLSGSPRRTKRFLNTLLLRLDLASDRGLHLDRRVLAKLMLLEYLREPFFRKLGSLQGGEGGRPAELAAAEQRFRTAVGSIEEDVPAKEDAKAPIRKRAPAAIKAESGDESAHLDTEVLEQWGSDPWMKEWLRSDPQLADVDLGPYFYVAREKVGDIESPLRLSPHAIDVLNRLLDAGEITQSRAMNEVSGLTEAEGAAIFQNLVQRLRQTQVLDKDSLQPLVFRYVQKRPELLPQLVAIYGDMPESKLTTGSVPALWKVSKDTPAEAAARTLLTRWSTSARADLAGAAKAVLGTATPRV